MTQTNGKVAGNAHLKLPETRFGFIGIGQMGWGMAMNLRKKIDPSSKLVVCEVSENRRNQFIKEAPGPVEVANSPKEVAERAVSPQRHPMSRQYHPSIDGEND